LLFKDSGGGGEKKVAVVAVKNGFLTIENYIIPIYLVM
jgi:hypothetical protein